MENSLLEFHYNPDLSTSHMDPRLLLLLPRDRTSGSVVYLDLNDSPIVHLDEFSSEG